MEEREFNADNFVNYLLTEGDNVHCDDTCQLFNEFEKLPPYYDEAKFKRGQKFYHDNIMGMFFAKLLGLIINLALPKTVKILKLTKMSDTPLTAYRRYLATVYHMCVWYDKDFHPGSELWRSILSVKAKHNSASKRACAAGFGQLTQKDMALAQFGFMGFIVVRSDRVGIHHYTDEEMDAFVHLWRVIGRLFGIDDRFNLCRESLSETRHICNRILTSVLRPEMEKLDSGFMELAHSLVTGMWAMNPVLEPTVFLALIERLLPEDLHTKTSQNINDQNTGKLGINKEQLSGFDNDSCQLSSVCNEQLTCQPAVNRKQLISLSVFQRFRLNFILFVMYCLQFSVIRYLLNMNHYLALWLMRNFPFLAYKRYGYANSHVQIFNSDSHT